MLQESKVNPKKIVFSYKIVISVRVTKPTIPQKVMDNFIDLELQHTYGKLQAIENKISVLKDQNLRDIETVQANGDTTMADIQMNILKLEQEFSSKIGDIDNQISDSKSTVQQKLISKQSEFQKEINQLKKNRFYLEYKKYQELAQPKKVISNNG